jgi:uncharacterized protein
MSTIPNRPATYTKKQTQLRERYGSWAVVTGASDGIGLELANYLAEAGFNLVLVARRKEVLEKLASELAKQNNTETRVIAADLSQHSEVEKVLLQTRELQVGLFVAAAGFGTTGNLVESSLDSEVTMLEVNCRAVLVMTHEFGKRFADQKRGGIILFSSLVAFQGVPKIANYAATKAYIQSLAEGIRVELAPLGVDVLASAPGPTQSGFAARANMQMGAAATAKEVARGTLEALGKRTTVRPGFLSKVLEAALSLLPRPARVAIMARIMGGMTKHQVEISPKKRQL